MKKPKKSNPKSPGYLHLLVCIVVCGNHGNSLPSQLHIKFYHINLTNQSPLTNMNAFHYIQLLIFHFFSTAIDISLHLKTPSWLGPCYGCSRQSRLSRKHYPHLPRCSVGGKRDSLVCMGRQTTERYRQPNPALVFSSKFTENNLA